MFCGVKSLLERVQDEILVLLCGAVEMLVSACSACHPPNHIPKSMIPWQSLHKWESHLLVVEGRWLTLALTVTPLL